MLQELVLHMDRLLRLLIPLRRGGLLLLGPQLASGFRRSLAPLSEDERQSREGQSSCSNYMDTGWPENRTGSYQRAYQNSTPEFQHGCRRASQGLSRREKEPLFFGKGMWSLVGCPCTSGWPYSYAYTDFTNWS